MRETACAALARVCARRRAHPAKGEGNDLTGISADLAASEWGLRSDGEPERMAGSEAHKSHSWAVLLLE